MQVGDVALTPQITFLDTKAKIEAYPSPQEGMQAQQTDSPYQKAHYANGAWVWESGGGGIPGGVDTNIQYNDGGAFGGDANLTWNKTNRELTIVGDPFSVYEGAGVIKGVADGSAFGLEFLGGDSSIVDGQGGAIFSVGGKGDGVAPGGSIVNSGGEGGATGLGGDITFKGGKGGATSGDGGNIVFIQGASPFGNPGKIYFQTSSGYVLDFIMSLISISRSYTFPDKDGTFAMLDDIVVPTSPFLLMGG